MKQREEKSRQPHSPGARPVVASLVGLVLLASAIAAPTTGYAQDPSESQSPPDSIAVYFSPGGAPTAAVVAALDEAVHTVHVQAYSFTSAPIAKALVAAEKRGVQVTAILDRSNRTAQYSAADFLVHGGVSTFIDAKHAIAHNKIMIIDDEEVLTGSFNFTKAAEEKNAENLLVIHDQTLAEKYEKNWQLHLSHSEPYASR
jgi:phosphatidylserine/phosphatidylglycerophosphate/cardiolipin synthase-like enzyme